MSPIFVAEVSSNHNQDLNRCFEFIDKSAEIGCDAVKFQLFRIRELFGHRPGAPIGGSRVFAGAGETLP